MRQEGWTGEFGLRGDVFRFVNQGTHESLAVQESIEGYDVIYRDLERPPDGDGVIAVYDSLEDAIYGAGRAVYGIETGKLDMQAAYGEE